MGLIDQKGRLFGIINLIDLVVLLMVVVLAFGTYAKMAARAQQNQQVVLQEIEMDMFIKDVMPFALESFAVGDIVKDANSKTVLGTISAIRSEPYREPVVDPQGNYVMKEVPNKLNIILTVAGKAQVNNNSIKIQKDDVLVGNILIINTHKSKAQAVIIAVRTE